MVHCSMEQAWKLQALASFGEENLVPEQEEMVVFAYWKAGEH